MAVSVAGTFILFVRVFTSFLSVFVFIFYCLFVLFCCWVGGGGGGGE